MLNLGEALGEMNKKGPIMSKVAIEELPRGIEVVNCGVAAKKMWPGLFCILIPCVRMV